MNLKTIDTWWFHGLEYSPLPGFSTEIMPLAVLSKDEVVGYYIAHFGMVYIDLDDDEAITMVQKHGKKMSLIQAQKFFPTHAKELEENYKAI